MSNSTSETKVTKSDKDITTNNVTDNSMISNCIMSCNSCIINDKCDEFKQVIKDVEKKVKLKCEYDKRVQEIHNSGQNDVDQECDLDGLNDAISLRVKKVISNLPNTCTIEKSFVEQEYNRLNVIYDFNQHPQLEYLALDIIRNQLKKFRLDLIQSKYGIMQKIFDKQGNEIIKITPGMHYDIEYSKSSADTIKKMDEIKNGIKTTNINVDVNWDTILEKIEQSEKND